MRRKFSLEDNITLAKEMIKQKITNNLKDKYSLELIDRYLSLNDKKFDLMAEGLVKYLVIDGRFEETFEKTIQKYLNDQDFAYDYVRLDQAYSLLLTNEDLDNFLQIP